MNLNETQDYFKRLISSSSKKSEIKLYTSFMNTLTALGAKELTDLQQQAIDANLDSLNLKIDNENKRKFISGKYNEFKTFLLKDLSFISKGYYAGIWMTYGMVFGSGLGMTIGTVIGGGLGISMGISIGTGFGMSMGMIYGAAKDAEAKKQGLVL